MGDRARIVVGVDGSEASREVLRWAARQAELTDAVLEVIVAWWPPVTYGYTADNSDDADIEALARKTLDAETTEVFGPKIPGHLTTRLVEGHAAPILVDAARGAHLLVVGSHGLGAFTGLLLGSTSQHCVQHASCPVLVVHRRPSA